MLRFLKIDLITACVAILSVLTLAGQGISSNQTNQTENTTRIAERTPLASSVIPSLAASSQPVVRRLAKPLRMLANLGKASWYGSVLEGHRTASGEIFHKDDLTACHRTLPFGTMVKVVDVTSGRSVVVRINDRGVLADDRIIDLSSGAAESLGILRAGVARVRLEVLRKVPPDPTLSETEMPPDERMLFPL